jgi:hypothetical protein
VRRLGACDSAEGGAPVCSDANGKVTFNHLQQREPDTSEDGRCYPATTDPWGITDGAIEDVGS